MEKGSEDTAEVDNEVTGGNEERQKEETFVSASGDYDFTLTVEGHKIRVCKGVLCVASPVFQAMFKSDFKEKQEVELPGKKYEDFVEFICCFYPDKLKHVTGHKLDYTPEKEVRPVSPQSSGMSSPSAASSSSYSSSRSCSPIIIQRCDNRDPSWPSKIEIPFSKAPELKKPLDAGERLSADLRKILVRVVVDEVRLKTNHAFKRQFENVAERIVRKYPNSLQDKIDGLLIGSGHDSFMKQLISRNENLNRKGSNTEQTKQKFSGGTDTVTNKKIKVDSYGCVNWNPKFDVEENKLMSGIKECMKEMHTKKDINWQEVKELMRETYPLQRSEINSGTAMPNIISEWPFLQYENCLLEHARLLIGIDLFDIIAKYYDQKGERLTRFFRSDACGLKDVEPYFRTECVSNTFTFFPTVLMCVMKSFKESEEGLFMMVDESATKENVKESNNVNWPRLAVHGDTLWAAKPSTKFTLLVDDEVVIYKIEGIHSSLCALFAAYYVFNIEYPKQVAATLEFIQRSIVGLNPDRGCKVDQKKKTSYVNSKVLKLINDIASFEWWHLVDQTST